MYRFYFHSFLLLTFLFWRNYFAFGFVEQQDIDFWNKNIPSKDEDSYQRQLLMNHSEYHPFQDFTVSQYYQKHVCNNEESRVFCGLGHWIDAETAATCVNIGSFGWHNCCNVKRLFIHQNGKNGNGTMHNIFRHWQNKIISFSGDSLTQQTFHSIVTACLISNITFEKGFHDYECIIKDGDEEEHCQPIETGYYCFANHAKSFNQKRNSLNDSLSERSICTPISFIFLPQYNLTINYLYSYEQSIPEEYIPYKFNSHKFNYLHPHIFEIFTQLSDTMIVNIGAHYQKYSPILVTQILRFYRKVLESDMNENPLKKHIYRLTYPSHFGANSHFEIRPNGKCIQDGIPTWTSEIAKPLLGDKVYQLDYYDVMKSQGDLHSRGKRDDCLHWCYSYELFYPLYQLITKILNPLYDY